VEPRFKMLTTSIHFFGCAGMWRIRKLAAAGVCLGLAGLLSQSVTPRVSAAHLAPERGSGPTTIEIESSDIRLHAKFYRARSTQVETPAVILLHGWSFPETRPARYLEPYVDAFRKAGLAVLIPTLRGWAPTGGTDDCAGRQVEDVLAALEWLGKSPSVKAHQRCPPGKCEARGG
jgi:dipeptidyl aminopeptidase/acylaminoacyl peptidase